jgi:cytochrome P450
MNVKASRTVFWLLVRIWAKPGLIEEVRKEIAPFAQASQAPQQFAVPELPHLKIDLKGLVGSCMLLKACYYECLRLDSAPISIRSVRQDFTLTETHPSGLPGEHSAKYVLKAGTSVAIPLNAHLKDPRYIDCPSMFKPSRFLVPSRNDDGARIADAGTLEPFGGGEAMCPGRDFAEREVMALVAGILVLWEMEPTNPNGWVIPGHTASTGVAAPSTSIRVRIRRRQLPPWLGLFSSINTVH